MNTSPKVKILPLMGGKVPEVRKGKGYPDIFIRAIVSYEMDPARPEMRKTLYDFVHPPDKDALAEFKVLASPLTNSFRVAPHQSILLGCGFILELPDDLVAYIQPRGSTIKRGFDVLHDDVPIDPDFRGEPVFELYNGSAKFEWIGRHECLTQLVLMPRIIPTFVSVRGMDELSKTKRGNGNHGSSGK